MITTAADPVSEFLSRLEGVKRLGDDRWEARCPAHEDRRASLSVSRGDDGRALVRCHAGCSLEQVTSAAGIKVNELFPPRESSNGQARRTASTYDYRDETGELLYQVCRFDPKDFRQRRPDGKGGWIWNMEGVQRVLYQLPELLNAREDDPDAWVLIVEGEKDADNLRDAGFIATCNVGGAGKWRPEYSESLRDRRCCFIPDNDQAGEDHARHGAADVTGRASEVKIIHLPGLPPKGDVSDWLKAGGTAPELMSLIDAAPTWTTNQVEQAMAIADNQSANDPAPAILSIAQLCQGNPELRPPVIHDLLRQGETMNLISAPKIGKSWLAMQLAISIAAGRMWLERFQVEPGRVLIIDNELHQQTLANRLPKVANAMGVMLSEVSETLFVESLRGRLRDIYAMGSYFAGIERGRFKLIIIDAFYRMLPREADENSNADLAGVYNQIDRYADDLGSAFCLIHHSSKGIQAAKSVTDVGAGAGSQSRAADTHVVLRQHEVDGAVVLDAAVRSWAPIDPFCLRWDFPTWKLAMDLDPAALRVEKKRQRKEEKEQPKEPAMDWDAERFVQTFLKPEPQKKDLIVARAANVLRSQRQASAWLNLAEADGLIFRWSFEKDRTVYFATKRQEIFNHE